MSGGDLLIGGAGDDLLAGGQNGDTMRGGTDDDSYVVGSEDDEVVELPDEGHDRVTSTALNYVVAANVEDLAIKPLLGTAGTAFSGRGNVLANLMTGQGSKHQFLLEGIGGNDTLTGGSSAAGDFLYGGAGDDTLNGHGGTDFLNGGDGADLLNGGDGWDTGSYAGAKGAVILDVVTGGSGGDAAGDRFSSIEAIAGTRFADHITGGDAAMRLTGGSATTPWWRGRGRYAVRRFGERPLRRRQQ